MFDEKLCEKCRHSLFQSANPVLCEQCAEKLFETVKDYINENPDNTLKQIEEATGVELKYIKKWIQQGRIQFTSPEESERRKKIEKLKHEYEKLIREEQEKKETDKTGRFHTRNS